MNGYRDKNIYIGFSEESQLIAAAVYLRRMCGKYNLELWGNELYFPDTISRDDALEELKAFKFYATSN